MKKSYLIFGVLFLLASAFVGWACLKNVNLALASSSWEKAAGSIVRSELQNLSVGPKENYRALVEYTYTVGGAIYRGTRIRFADTTGSSEAAQSALVAQYPAGAAVDVYYDPKHPGEAVLENGGGLRVYGLLLPPVILAGIGMILLLQGRRQTLKHI
jgi:Protein of unknown function (DUF3592)